MPNLIFEDIQAILASGWLELMNFQFLITNPVFWLMIFVLFIVFLKLWDIKKSFSFSAIVAVILIVTTEVEHYVIAAFRGAGEAFDPVFIRIICLIVIGVLLFLYLFMVKNR